MRPCRAYPPSNLIHYRPEQGFKAVNAYSLCQDSKGYIWIGTENGLMRFNGRSFKVYTTRDGLPDNEILAIEEGPEGRLWLLPFANTVCYIQDGVIYHTGNSKLLRRLKLASRPLSVCFDKKRDIWINTNSELVRLSDHGSILNIPLSSPRRAALRNSALWNDASGALMLAADSLVYRWDGRRLVYQRSVPFRPECVLQGKDYAIQLQPGKLLYKDRIRDVTFPEGVSGIFKSDKDQLFVATSKGLWILDALNGTYSDSLLLHHKTGCFLKARDGSYWVGTIGNGLFNIRKTAVYKMPAPPGNPSVRFIKAIGQEVYSTTDHAWLTRYVAGNRPGSWGHKDAKIDPVNNYRHYLYAGRNKKQEYIFCSDSIRLKKHPGQATLRGWDIFCKTVFEESDTTLLIGSNTGVFRLHKDAPSISDTFLAGTRVVALAKMGAVIYAGTLNGLIACMPGGKYRVMNGPGNACKGHITALCTGKEGTLWVGNSRGELVVLRHDKVLATVGPEDGLQCNRIACLKTSDSLVWIGTENGLYAVEQQRPYRVRRHLTYSAGLSSNQVNCLDVYGHLIWVGTVNGVNYFNEGAVLREANTARIIINSIRNGEAKLLPGNDVLSLKDGGLTIDFDVVDDAAGSAPVFQYRLSGYGDWMPLEGGRLHFPSLPYGDFLLTIRAFVPDWPEGAVFQQRFSHPQPFYRSWWFGALVVLLSVVVVVAIAVLVVRRIRRKDKQALLQQQKLLQMEQAALQARMNPHFIFNCMAAVKHLYGTGDADRAEHFVDEFSSLIRQTFEMEDAIFTTLDKELEYLERYLNIERERFDHSFTFAIKTQPGLDLKDMPVPVMLLQPLVENAIRHGIRHRTGNTGRIAVSISRTARDLIIVITDNGTGFDGSASTLQRAVRERPLTSSVVNNRRINILNRLFDGQISVQCTSLSEMQSGNSGTEISITYPLNIHQQIRL